MLTTRQIGPCFAAEVEGFDLTRPLTPADAKDVHAAMDEYAVLVFHGRPITQEQQMAFTLSLGEIEHATGTGLRETYRLPTTFADVSNIDANDQLFARDSRTRLFALGNRLWCPRSTRSSTPTASRPGAATPSSPTCARRTRRWMRTPGGRSRI